VNEELYVNFVLVAHGAHGRVGQGLSLSLSPSLSLSGTWKVAVCLGAHSAVTRAVGLSSSTRDREHDRELHEVTSRSAHDGGDALHQVQRT
jgi:hypothetical protein